MMKRSLFLAMLCFSMVLTWARIPVKTTCQFEIRDASGDLVTGGDVHVKLSVLQGSQSGEPVYVEVHDCEVAVTGMVSVTLGEGGGVPSWSSLIWSNQSYYVKAEIQKGMEPYTDAGLVSLVFGEVEDANMPVNSYGSKIYLSTVATTGNYSDLTNKPHIPGSVAEMSDAEDYVTISSEQTISGDKTYIGINDFSNATMTVASGYTLGTTTSQNCTATVVNACDLAMVFDSLQRQFSDVMFEIDNLRDTLANLRYAFGPIANLVDSVVGSDSFSFEFAIMDNGGFEIPYATVSVYPDELCSGEPLWTADIPVSEALVSGVVENLAPHTSYCVKVEISNGHKSSVESIAITTQYGVPIIDENVIMETTGNSISIDASLLSLGGATTDVTVSFYTSEDYSGDPLYEESREFQSVGDVSFVVNGLSQNTSYYILIVADNGHFQDTIRISQTTLQIVLTITSDPQAGEILLCGSSPLEVTYTASLTGIAPDDFVWSVSGGEGTSDGNTYIVKYSSAGTYTVTCTVSGITETDVKTVQSAGQEAKMAFCEDCEINKVKIRTGGNCQSYVWKNAAGETVSTSNTELVVSSTTPVGIYTLTGTNSYGCSVSRTVRLGRNTLHPCTVAGTLRSGTSLGGGLYANKEFGEGSRLDSVSDHQGNVYKVVEIDGRCWLAENMRATTSPTTGSTILLSNMVASSCSKAAAWYRNNEAGYKKYGLLYNWCAANDTFNLSAEAAEVATEKNTTGWQPVFSFPRRGICPAGWHVPTRSEWQYFSSNTAEGVTGKSGRMASGCDWKGTSTDASPDNYAYAERNKSGFSVLPAGYFMNSGFLDGGINASFWSSDQSNTNHGRYWGIISAESGLTLDYIEKYHGFSVRCIRD